MIVVSNDVTTNMTNTTNRPAIEPTGTTCTGILSYIIICMQLYVCVCHTMGNLGG